MSSQSADNLRQWLEFAPELDQIAERAYTKSGAALVCPHRRDVFRAFKDLSPTQVRVVVLGQDPYHAVNSKYDISATYKAMGRAFAYSPLWTGPVNSSLLNIILEAGAEPSTFDTSLQHWVDQGVLLLNTRLTVLEEQPMSHAGIGWEGAIRKVLLHIATAIPNVVWLLWGSEARAAADDVGMGSASPLVIATTHPCKYSNTRGAVPFTGSDCFGRVNERLIELGQKPIDWVGGGACAPMIQKAK